MTHQPPRGGRRGDRPPGRRPYGDRPPSDHRGMRGDRPRFSGPRPPRRDDEGGMLLHLDPRNLLALKRLAGEAGVRPGELAHRWIVERLDAERRGGPAAAPEPAGALAEVEARLEALARRIDAIEAERAAAPEAAEAPEPEAAPVTAEDAAPKRRGPGRPRKAPAAKAKDDAGNGARPKVALHDEIIAVIAERGPLSAAELAEAINDRGRYAPPRSSKALDAATVNSRVSNPVYRDRFVRAEGRIGLARETPDGA